MYIDKDRVRVLIFTDLATIEGDLHLLAGSRLTDALNTKAYDFYAVTDATLRRPDDGEEMRRSPYIAVSRESMRLVVPLEEA